MRSPTMTGGWPRYAVVPCITAIAMFPAWAGAGAAPASAAPQVVGVVSAALNQVSIKPVALPKPHRAALKDLVALGDDVLTGTKSQLQVLLLDKSVFTVGANARLTINRYAYDPAKGRSFGASIAKGAFRFMSGKPDRRNNASIDTPIATIGIRGTLFDGVVGKDALEIVRGENGIDKTIKSDPETASLIVLRGPGQRTQGNEVVGAIDVTAGNKTVVLDRPMLAAYVPRPGAVPLGPFMISNAGLARINALLFANVAEHRAARNLPKNSGFQFRLGLPLPGFGGKNPASPNPVGRTDP